MKGSVAAFIAALHDIAQDEGTISLIITGDEEGAATYGTVKLIDHMRAQGIKPDLILVGEPTSVPPPWRHDQGRPPGQRQHVDRGRGPTGPCRLSASGR
jgi:acetylornithine deacetylase/succinyl-diaminopimelate desuccinylase-like protein